MIGNRIAVRRGLWTISMALMVHGCSHMPTQLDADQQHRDSLRRIDNWRAEGKLGVRVGDEAQSAYFDWHNQDQSFSLRLSGPFGQGTTWLRRRGPVVTLETADQPIRRATSAEQLMQAQLGWQVPVSNLRYWIKGLAAPRHPVAQLRRNPDGTLAELQQQDWHITYSRYGLHNGWILPGKLVAKRDTVTLTMIIKSWQTARTRTP
jgi:outer membrane lipoprotein LolB